MPHTITKRADSHLIADEAGETIAEMTFSNTPTALIIDSTYVREDHRGEGLGNALLDSVIAMAREQGRKVVPLCAFAKAQVEKDPGRYGDVVYRG